MDRFTRFKRLRVLWARAKHLLACLHGPQAHEQQLRAYRWQQMQSTVRALRDGMVRGPGDPDSASSQLGAAQQWQEAQRRAFQRWGR